jgi:exosortase A-associated hydrolase 1
VAVVIVVGGPQYRVGSHRQFLLLARALAAEGFACLRFDYRGMGDSEGPRVGFEGIESDITAAIDALQRHVPAVSGVVLWGLCDGAAAAALCARKDPRIRGLALFNPWVRTDAVAAESRLKNYYARRLTSLAFWRKLAAREVGLADSLKSLLENVRRASRRFGAHESGHSHAALPDRVGTALLDCGVPVLVGLSERDGVAEEFRLVASRAGPLLDFKQRRRPSEIAFAADHTFSSKAWRDEAARATLEWLRREFAGSPAASGAPARAFSEGMQDA